jgi:hypothetical protein
MRRIRRPSKPSTATLLEFTVNRQKINRSGGLMTRDWNLPR